MEPLNKFRGSAVQDRFLLLQNLHFRHPWRPDALAFSMTFKSLKL
jgi:hypothetical protein